VTSVPERRSERCPGSRSRAVPSMLGGMFVTSGDGRRIRTLTDVVTMPSILNPNLPVISFDTSVFNRMLDDGPEAEPIFIALKHGYHFRLIAPNVEEIMANTKLARREELFRICRRLAYQGEGDTIQPHQELLRLLISRHAGDPAHFVWQNVNMISPDYHDGIGDWELIRNNELSTEQRAAAKAANNALKPVWRKLKPQLAEIFSRSGEGPPRTFSETISRVQHESSLPLGIGKLLYDHVTKGNISETDVSNFMSVCPPFRAIVYAFLMMWYEDAVRDAKGEKFKAGRADLFMAAYLPYCHQFITAEKKREQEKCLREVAAVAGLTTVVRSYEDFCSRFMVLGVPA
jgi:hypothetical protein